jgi:hypothetical protein
MCLSERIALTLSSLEILVHLRAASPMASAAARSCRSAPACMLLRLSGFKLLRR